MGRNKAANRAVLVLGWGGSKPRSISRIADFYAERGVDTVSFIMPLVIPHFARMALLRPIVLHLQQLRGQGVESFDVHAFSNNGCWAWATLSDMLDGPATATTAATTAASATASATALGVPALGRLVLDSGPQLFYEDIGIHEEVRVFSRVLTSIVLGRAEYQHAIVTPALKLLLYCTSTFHRIIRLVQQFVPWLNIVPPYLQMNHYLRDGMPAVPTRFMYSADDGLIPASSIHTFSAELRIRLAAAGHSTYTAIEQGQGQRQGLPMVTEKVFRGVGHTAPYFDRSTRDEYREDLSNFLQLPGPVGPAKE